MDKPPWSLSNKRTVPRKGNGSRDTLTQSLRAELVADEGGNGDIVAEFLAGLVERASTVIFPAGSFTNTWFSRQDWAYRAFSLPGRIFSSRCSGLPS